VDSSKICVVELSELAPKGDVSDWLDAGHTPEELKDVITATPILDAASLKKMENRWLEEGKIPTEKLHSKTTKAPVEKITQAQILIEQAADVELFHTSDHEGYATFTIGGHKETWKIGSRSFRRFLIQKFYKREKKPPSQQALQDVLQLLEAKAQFDGAEEEIFTRVAGDSDRIYLDLANEKWAAAEITVDGWSVVGNPDVKFRRTPGMLPLPEPVHGGSLEELRPLINAQSEETWVLDVAWLVGSLKPTGPYPLDVTLGEHGSAKSTRQQIKRSLIDPIKAPLRSAPPSDRDLMISAKNGWVITLDNLSKLPAWLSDALCRLATGGGFSTRGLYTDDEEMIFESCRPIALNAIANMVSRSDLVDRALINNISPIPEDKRKTKDEVLSDFEKAHPRILGALLDAVVEALRNYKSVKLEKLPRMADFAKWVVAAEPVLPWASGTFLKAYNQNRSGAIEATLETDPLATAVRELMKDQKEWKGTSTELLSALEALVDDRTKKEEGWPGSAAWLTRKLKRPATFLRSVGIDIDFPVPGEKLPITVRKRPQNVRNVRNVRNDSLKPSSNNNLPIPDKTPDIPDEEKLYPESKPLLGKGLPDIPDIPDKKQPFSNSRLESSESSMNTELSHLPHLPHLPHSKRGDTREEAQETPSKGDL